MFRLYQLLRLFYYPFFNWLFAILPKIRSRLEFERHNKTCEYSKSFKNTSQVAEVCFEVSSEGELEQIRPVLMKALRCGSLVELVYASDSVDKQCKALCKEYPQNLRIYRYPLLTYFPGRSWSDPLSWISAKKLVLCRYDFFPELLRYGRSTGVDFILLSASLKNFDAKASLVKKFYSFSYKSFDKIVAATDLDQERFRDKLGLEVKSFDFRPLVIESRQSKAFSVLSDKFPDFDLFLSLSQNFEKRNRLVFGSFWDYETEAVLETFDFNNNLICMVPHKLDKQSLAEMTTKVQQSLPNHPVYEWNHDSNNNAEVIRKFIKKPGPIIINLKGVLCELYTIFGAAFVGGGHGVSVHSLLEPFMAGCMVYCGPRVHRSTEYDLIIQKHPDRLRIVDRLENVVENFKSDISTQLSDITKFIEDAKFRRSEVLSWLEIGNEETNGAF